jgi:hypothetical protein
VVARQVPEASAQDRKTVLILQANFGIVGWIYDGFGVDIVQRVISTPTERRNRREPRDRQDPSRNLATALEAVGVLPNLGENVACQILGKRLVADEPHEGSKSAHAVSRIQDLHRAPIALANALEQRFVGFVLRA